MTSRQQPRKMTIRDMMMPSEVALDNYSSMVENQDVRTESSILRPIAQVDNGTNGMIKYNLENKGILSPNSRLVFAGTCGSAYSVNGAFYPLLVGGMAVIKNARLKIGNRTIATSQNFNQFYANQRGLVKSCKRLGVDAVEKLTNDNYAVCVNRTQTSNNGIGVYTGTEDASTGTTFKDDVEFNGFSNIGHTSDNTPSFSVSLKELFPYFTDEMDLPLFLFSQNENVSIEIDLENEGSTFGADIGKRSVMLQTNSTGNFTQTLLNSADTKMIVDYIYLPQEKFAEIENAYKQRGDITSYIDLQLVETTLTDTIADTDNRESVILTGTDRIVRGVFANVLFNYGESVSNASNVANQIGRYYSNSYNTARGINFRVNNRLLLNIDSSRQKNSDLYYYYSTWNANQNGYIPEPLYTDNSKADDSDSGMTDNHCNGLSQTHLRGMNSPIGMSFGNEGYNVKSVPIEMELFRKDDRALDNNRLMAWCLVRRIFSVNQNGSVSVSF